MMDHSDQRDVEFSADPSELADRAAAWLVERVRASGPKPSVCLSGGEIPALVYRTLAERHARNFPWDRVHWFWGDERFVPTSDRRNNFRLVKDAMLDRVPVPPENIHRIPTDSVALSDAAAAYERELKLYYGESDLRADRPLFDICILGLGDDGHTASLFPGAPVLDERERWVAPVTGFADEPRITLTYPVLESSAHSAFVVAGPKKRRILTEIWQGRSDAPSARIRPIGTVKWFVDRTAAPAPR